ncbi:hypothetical protein JX266_012749 [Neoarthrinium moseri]|nr:hypothetical protein JX266_012749 [Neoarthrinium moseri]
MASILGSLVRLIIKSRPSDGRHDEELGGPHPPGNAGVASSTTMDPAVDGRSSYHFGSSGRLSQRMPASDPLATFRLMMGITSSPYLGFSQHSRPAPNIGIYARVVYAEQKAKDSFKIFSLLINCCYFLQIVVAAALTAMGAANADNKAITAFGAINTIMAGLLTFLKGSGLPARYKYYGNEWKKIREFIEAKEREFAREDCVLNVYEVVDTIQQMYENVKQEIEINTPDSYTSITNNARMTHDAQGKIGGLIVSKLDGLSNKLLDTKDSTQKLASGAEKHAHGILDDLHQSEKKIGSQIRTLETSISKEIESYSNDIERKAHAVKEVGHSAERKAKAVKDISKDAVEGTGRVIAGDTVVHGDDKRESNNH